MNGEIYLDNSATMPMNVVMLDKSRLHYGNPSSQHAKGYEAAEDVANAKEIISSELNCMPEEIYFTSGGTESDNWALRGILKPHDHLITTSFEHHAILKTAKYLERMGVEVTYVAPHEDSIVRLKDIIAAKKPNTKMVSVMYVNNEVGTIQPIREIADWAKSEGLIVHTDAVQAVGHMKINLLELGVDLMSASSHKFGGCRNTGFLFVRSGTPIEPMIFGGSQQNGMRAGTLDNMSISIMARALKASSTDMLLHDNALNDTWQFLVDGLLGIDGVSINGSLTNRLRNNVNAYIKDVDAQALVTALSELDIYVSAGAACNEGEKKPSHVLKAMGLSDEVATHSIRISMNYRTEREEIEKFLVCLKQCIDIIRATKGVS